MVDYRIQAQLIEKYNTQAPRYTSYPPANFFTESFGPAQYLSCVEQSNREEPRNISIYIHIPFCNQLCLYCGCNTHVTKDKGLMRKYVDALKKEILIIGRLLDDDRKVSQVHWGGGTPNTLPAGYIEEIMDLLKSEFRFTDSPEIAIECNPAYLDETYIGQLASFGFNRISLGIQDFDQRVLKAVNREEPAIPAIELCGMIRAHGGMSVNLDLIYGLPYQTAGSFSEAVDKAIAAAPQRLVTFSYAHVPWVKAYQKKLEQYGLPEPAEKVRMFEKAWKRLSSAGYVSIGLDHYAKPDDDLAKALKNRTLHRNFQGYCTRETTGQVYAFGTTGISQLAGAYAQNTKSVKEYINSLEKGEILIAKGYSLSRVEKIVRHIINEIMCNQFLSWNETASRFGTTPAGIKSILDFRNEKLDGFRSDQLLDYNEDELTIYDTGRFFLRNIAGVFDIHISDPDRKYSKTV